MNPLPLMPLSRMRVHGYRPRRYPRLSDGRPNKIMYFESARIQMVKDLKEEFRAVRALIEEKISRRKLRNLANAPTTG